MYGKANACLLHALFPQTWQDKMADKSDLKAELERKKQRLAQIREEKKRKEEERKKKEVSKGSSWHSLDLSFRQLKESKREHL